MYLTYKCIQRDTRVCLLLHVFYKTLICYLLLVVVIIYGAKSLECVDLDANCYLAV